MRKSVHAAAFGLALVGLAMTAEAAGIPTINDETTVRPTCLDHYKAGARANGFYIVSPRSERIVVYCLHTIRYRGQTGGWTLVWSNLGGIPDKPFRDLRYTTSLVTPPVYKGAFEHTAKPALTDFMVYTGLRTWQNIVTRPGSRQEILYRWSPGPQATPLQIRAVACPFQLDPALGWRVSFSPLGLCQGVVGPTTLPAAGFFTVHEGAKWSAIDMDADTDPARSCARDYGSPFWYQACWSGAIVGYGGKTGFNDFHGAHWDLAKGQYGDPATGLGAGDGWLLVR